MGEVQHRIVRTNGINMHIAEQGSGPVVLLLHGFPSIWYMWRKQMAALAEAGFRAVAPDQRGYGQTDVPGAVEDYTFLHLVGDIVGLLDALGEQQVFVVGHDWGAGIGWGLCMLRPDRVKAYVSLGIIVSAMQPYDGLDKVKQQEEVYGENFYICRFQEPGRAERDFASVGTSATLTGFLSGFWDVTKGTVYANKGEELPGIFTKELAPWLTQEDLQYYTENFERTGFTGGLNWYRNVDRNCQLLAPWVNCPVMTKAYLIKAEDDAVNRFPGYSATEEVLKAAAPNLQRIDIVKGAHFMPEQNPEEINEKLVTFFKSELQNL